MKSRPICATEKALEQRVAGVLTDNHYFNFHNDPTMMPGIPDRYVVRGCWIEFKNEPTFDATKRSLNRQRKWLNILDNAGDQALVCVLIGNELYFESWSVWKLREQRKIGRLTVMMGSPFRVKTVDDIDAVIVGCFA